ncbi:hypothetical protein BKA65DRAFT_500501 [Rhexocercosporidium sp. MPI-PUGE-AT-0058]|nr:hypothetical protein BKA65DRAFT_500501 [Rhexocercosporidium sp. MPI-PUGE-AT-0058]
MAPLIKSHILVFNPVQHALENHHKLSLIAQTKVLTNKNQTEFLDECRGKYEDIVAIYSTSSIYTVNEKFDKDFLQSLPPSLKPVVRMEPVSQ